MKRLEIFFGIIKIPFDFAVSVLAFMLAYRLRLSPDLIPGFNFPYDPNEIVSASEYFNFGLIASGFLVLLFALNGMYTLKTTFRLNKELGKVFMLSLAWLTIIIFYFFVIREFPYSRLALAYSWALMVLFVWIAKILISKFQKHLLRKGFGQRRTLIIGNNKLTTQLLKTLEKNLSYKVVDIITKDQIKDLAKIAKAHEIDEMIQTQHNIAHADAEDILDLCREHHIHYSFIPDLLETQRSNVEISTINNIPIISLKSTALDGWGKVYKRIFDFIGASLALIITLPVTIITAIAIKIEDPKATIFFKYLDDGRKAKRVGQYGKKFYCYKFRSMKPGTHSMRYKELSEKNLRKGTPMVKIADDPRITKVGRFIRKTSIDELPSLWNVLKGEMSLVGPRPHLPEEVSKYEKHHKFVLTIKPGVTGLAQITGRSDLHFEEEVKLDTYYIEQWSIWLDIKIIFKTFGVLLKGYRE